MSFSTHKTLGTEKPLCIKFLSRGVRKTPFGDRKTRTGAEKPPLKGLKNPRGVGKTPGTGVEKTPPGKGVGKTPPGGQFDPWGAGGSKKPLQGDRKTCSPFQHHAIDAGCNAIPKRRGSGHPYGAA